MTRADTRIEALLGWFAEHGRDLPWRRTREKWPVLVSEVCLQQTQLSRGLPYVERILDRFPQPAALASAPLAELLALWQGLGYPRRARFLWLAAQQIAEDGWPERYEDLPGVGRYTAAALRCFADEESVVPPDINTRRVGARLFPEGFPMDAVPAGPRAWSFGQAVMELGQLHCRARAVCGSCPMAALCPSEGTAEVVASPRQARYEGSMRQRRGDILRALSAGGAVDAGADREAAAGLIADGLAHEIDGTLQLGPAHSIAEVPQNH